MHLPTPLLPLAATIGFALAGCSSASTAEDAGAAKDAAASLDASPFLDAGPADVGTLDPADAGTEHDAGPADAGPDSVLVGACTEFDGSDKMCTEFYLPADAAEAWGPMFETNCTEGSSTNRWGANCDSGYAATCTFPTSSQGAVIILHHYSSDSTTLDAMEEACAAVGATWSEP